MNKHAIVNSSRGVEFAARRHDDFATFAQSWRAFEADGSGSAFQAFQWLKAADISFARGKGRQSFIIELIDVSRGRTVMLLPLVRRVALGRTVIEFLGCQVSDISAPAVADDFVFPIGAGNNLWNAIVSALPPADVIAIDQITSEVCGRPNPLAELPGLTLSSTKSFDVVMEGDSETVVQRLANNQTRRILKTSARRMAERGDVRFIAAETADDVERLYSAMVAQRGERFKELGRFDHLSDPVVADFYRNAALASLGGEGPVQLFGLSVDGQVIATTYTLIRSDTIHLTIVTMTGGDWHSCSPGMAILAKYMEWARNKGLRVMDFSVGDMAYKSGFGGKPQDRFTLLAPLTGKGKCAVAITRHYHALKQKVKSTAGLSRFIRAILAYYRAKLKQ
jgi:CelD/BcsL family acetyltransferase involved in cellulose biosynthesis